MSRDMHGRLLHTFDIAQCSALGALLDDIKRVNIHKRSESNGILDLD